MEDELSKRVVGQRRAVQAVSDAVRRSRPASPTRTGRPGVHVPRPDRCR
ncbi:hypothetical protein I552_7437 [Mycobacterium xenopi 3993]|nr:hypothetical protein I552_7437 [Mycobacterium xenopi 3993]